MANDFNKDMGSYLSKRKSGSSKTKEGFENDINKADFKDIEEVEHEIDQLENARGEEYNDDENKQGFFKSLFKSLGLSKEPEFEEEADESYPELDEDVKKVLRITFDWINRLPPEIKLKFKESQDFVEYKAILQKYGLVKNK